MGRRSRARIQEQGHQPERDARSDAPTSRRRWGPWLALGCAAVIGLVVLARPGMDRVPAPDAIPGAGPAPAAQRPPTPTPDPEPDDTPERARPVSALDPGRDAIARHAAGGRWSTPGDVDCHRIPLEVPGAGAVLRLEVRPGAGATPRLWVLGEEGERLAEVTAARAGASAVVPALGARAWEASYVACTTAAGGEPGGSYALEVRTWTPEGPFEFEPNDDRGFASALPRGTTLQGHLPAGDTDWYRISHGPEPAVRVELRLPSGMQAELSLYDAEARELGREVVRGTRATIERPGAVLVRIRAGPEPGPEATYSLDARGVAIR